MTVGATTSAALYFHRLFNPVGSVIEEFDEIQRAGASLARLAGVAGLEPPRPPAVVREPAGGELELAGVRHRYADGPLVLDDVSVRVAPGERLAVVGASGAGKSTLAGIAAGLLDPVAGAVRLGGLPVGELDRGRHIAMLSQEVHVFSGPLIADLRLARAATDGRTSLIVAHRLTQAELADRVLVLDHGRVVETGTHPDLVAAGGRYAELWRSWTGGGR